VDGPLGLLAIALRRLGFDESAIVSPVVIFFRLGGLSSIFQVRAIVSRRVGITSIRPFF
jgi:hypothetical protein